MDLVDINTNDPDRIKYMINLLRVNVLLVTKEFLKSRNVPDIGSIPISSEDYINKSKNITQEQIDNIMFPEVLSPLQQEFKFCHYKLSHPHPKSMFRLAKLGFLSLIFLDLKDDVPLFSSCIYGSTRRRQWITKGNKSGSLGKILTTI